MKKRILMLSLCIMAFFFVSCTHDDFSFLEENLTLAIGESAEISYRGKLSGELTSSNESIVTIEGAIATGVSAGSAEIRVGDDTLTITVTKAEEVISYDEMSLPLSELSISIEESAELIPAIYHVSGTERTLLSLSADKFSWRSEDTLVATVENGLITGVGVGSTTITASYGELSASCVVKVGSGTYHTLALSIEKEELEIGEVIRLSWSVSRFTDDVETKEDVPASAISFTSSDVTVATVEDGVVTAVGRGTATICAQYEGATSYVTLSVKDTVVITLKTVIQGEYNDVKSTVLDASTTALETDTVIFGVILEASESARKRTIDVSIKNLDIAETGGMVNGETFELEDSDSREWEGLVLSSDGTKSTYYFAGALKYGSDPSISVKGDYDFVSSDGTEASLEASVAVEVDELAHVFIHNITLVPADYIYYQQFDGMMARADQALSEGRDYITFATFFFTIMNTMVPHEYAIIQKMKMLRDAGGTAIDEEILTASIEEYTKVIKWIRETIAKVNETPFRASFFSGMTEEWITDFIAEYGPLSAEAQAALDESQAILEEYNALDDHSSSDISSLYSEFVTANNTYSESQYGCDYLTYTYEKVHERGVTPLDLSTFNDQVAHVFIPSLAFLEAHSPVAGELEGNDALAQALYLYLGDGRRDDAKAWITSFYESVGSDYASTMTDFFENGSYIFAGALDGGEGGAYTTYLDNDGVCYFGAGDNTLLEIIHETGHYYATHKNGALTLDTDLSELQSQGAEALFAAYYLLNDEQWASSFEGEAFIHFYLVSKLSIIILATIINDFETQAYQGTLAKGESYDDLMIDVCADYGGYDYLVSLGLDPIAYYKEVLFNQPGYYISYALSGVASLELFANARQDYDEATRDLLALDSVSTSQSFVSALTSVGLISPNDNDEVFYKIACMLEEIVLEGEEE